MHNLPTRVDAANGEYSITQYSGAGTKLSTTYFDAPVVKAISDKVNSARQSLTRFYVDDYVFEKNDALVSDAMAGKYGRMKYCRFDGGYFDADGRVHYYVPDFQGNTAMDIAADGTVVQQTHYYPYGEPWSRPQGQPWLYGGKERELRGPARGDSDFGARTLAAARGSFAQPDPLAEKYPHLNPYAFCAADPVNHTDPTGMAIYIADNKNIGNDGVVDGKIYVLPNQFEKQGKEKVSTTGATETKVEKTIQFIKDNSGNTEAFNKSDVNSVAVLMPNLSYESLKTAENHLKKDNGGGESTNEGNYQEHGGYFSEDGFVPVESGPVADPSIKGGHASIKFKTNIIENFITIHSHPSGTKENGETISKFVQTPSDEDIENTGKVPQIVVAKREGTIYIHNNIGTFYSGGFSGFIKSTRIKK